MSFHARLGTCQKQQELPDKTIGRLDSLIRRQLQRREGTGSALLELCKSACRPCYSPAVPLSVHRTSLSGRDPRWQDFGGGFKGPTSAFTGYLRERVGSATGTLEHGHGRDHWTLTWALLPGS